MSQFFLLKFVKVLRKSYYNCLIIKILLIKIFFVFLFTDNMNIFLI